MGLEDLNDSDTNNENGSNSNRRYERISLVGFEQALDELPYEFHAVSGDDARRFDKEYVYAADVDSFLAPKDLEVRVYSSIDKRTNMSRDKGKDAIRTVVYSRDRGRMVGGKRHTKRTPGWARRLREKVEELMQDWEETVDICDECGDYMVKREGQYGEFLGCLNYPDCENTRQIN